MLDQNKAIARRMFEEIESQGKFAAADEIFSTDFVNYVPIGEMHGPEGAKQLAMMLRNGFPDLHVTIEDQFAKGDKVATRWTARGTHRGEFQGISATGRQMQISGIVISRIVNGKIVEQWGNPDLLGLMQQLGVVPAPEQTG